MEIILAKNNSFCGGVRRAYRLVEDNFSKLNQGKNKTAYILGSLAHNLGVEKKVQNWGVCSIKNLRKIKKGDEVIITAHGCSRATVAKIGKKGADIFDTTCYNVKKIHELVADYSEKGYGVIIFGDKKHKEVMGIRGWAKCRPVVVDSLLEAKECCRKILSKRKKPFILVSQTTQNIKKYQKISKIFREYAKRSKFEMKAFNTICNCSEYRQTEAGELARKCQGILVVGGGNSANTKRLWQEARKNNKNVFWIKDVYSEGFKEMFHEFFKKSWKKVGILSGASTPKWEIERVVDELRKKESRE